MTKSEAIKAAEFSCRAMIVYLYRDVYRVVSVHSAIPARAKIVYKTGVPSNYGEKPHETYKTFTYKELAGYVRRETIDPDGRVVSRSQHVEHEVRSNTPATRNRHASGS